MDAVSGIPLASGHPNGRSRSGASANGAAGGSTHGGRLGGTRSGGGRVTTPRSRCPGSRLVSSVVNFGDPLPYKELALSEHHARCCDLMLVLVSSLMV
jgi:hypothetical protein